MSDFHTSLRQYHVVGHAVEVRLLMLIKCRGGLKDRLISLKQSLTHSYSVKGGLKHSGTAFTTWLELTNAGDFTGFPHYI